MLKKHPYNKARNEFMKLRRFDPGSSKYKSILLDVIRFSKAAIQKNKNDGDAHVLLSNAYYLSSLLDFPSEYYSRYLPLAAAVIFEWRSRPMYTKDKVIGDKMYQGILDALNREIPEWMNVSKPEGTIQELHEKYFEDSIV